MGGALYPPGYAPSVAAAALGAAGLPGHLRYVTDGQRGLWLDNGTTWRPVGRGIDPRDYGVMMDNVTDDTTAWLAVIAASLANRAPIDLPPGDSVISDTLVIAQAGVHLWRGAGGSEAGGFGTRFVWKGPADRAAIKLQDVARPTMKDFSIGVYSNAYPLLCGIQIENLSGTSSYTPHMGLFESVYINGTVSYITDGWRLAQGAGTVDANNDFYKWVNCESTNYANAGWNLGHSQAKAQMFLGCKMAGAPGVGQYGVYAVGQAGGTTPGGALSWYGGGGAWNGAADFWIATDDCLIIDGFNGEKSARLLYVPGGTSAQMPISIRGVRWAHAGHVIAGGYIVDCQCPGPLVVETSQFQSAPYVTTTAIAAGSTTTTINVNEVLVPASLTGFGISPVVIGKNGANNGQIRNLNAATAGSFSVSSPWSGVPADGDTFVIYWPMRMHNAIAGSPVAMATLRDLYIENEQSSPFSSNNLFVNSASGVLKMSNVVVYNRELATYKNSGPNWMPVQVAKVASYTLAPIDEGTIVQFDTTAGVMTATLPAAASYPGVTFRIKLIKGANQLTIATTSSQTIDGNAASTYNTSTAGTLLVVTSDGTNWVKAN